MNLLPTSKDYSYYSRSSQGLMLESELYTERPWISSLISLKSNGPSNNELTLVLLFPHVKSWEQNKEHESGSCWPLWTLRDPMLSNGLRLHSYNLQWTSIPTNLSQPGAYPHTGSHKSYEDSSCYGCLNIIKKWIIRDLKRRLLKNTKPKNKIKESKNKNLKLKKSNLKNKAYNPRFRNLWQCPLTVEFLTSHYYG